MKKFNVLFVLAGVLMAKAFEGNTPTEAGVACEGENPGCLIQAVVPENSGIYITDVKSVNDNSEKDGDDNYTSTSLIQKYDDDSSETINWSYQVVGEKANAAVSARREEAKANANA